MNVLRSLKGLIKGNRWTVLGNEEQAGRLANFLNCCEESNIEPISPIRLKEGSLIMVKTGFEQELYSSNALDEALSRMGHWKNESRVYVRSPDGCCMNQFKDSKNVIAALEELDAAGYPLPYLHGLNNLPEIIRMKVNAFRDQLAESGMKLSDSHPDEGLFRIAMRGELVEAFHVAAPFEYSRVVNGVEVDTLGKVHYKGKNVYIEDIEMRVKGVPVFDDKAWEELGKIEFVKDASREGGLTRRKSFSCSDRKVHVQGTYGLGYLVVQGNLPLKPIKYSLFDNSERAHLIEAERVVGVITSAIPRKRE